MENKNTVIDAKIGNLNKLTKVLSVKEQAQEQLLVVIKALGIGHWASVKSFGISNSRRLKAIA